MQPLPIIPARVPVAAALPLVVACVLGACGRAPPAGRSAAPVATAASATDGAAPGATPARGPLRIASLARSGSSSAQAIDAWAGRIAQRTEGGVRLQVRFDGAEGDELEVVAKLRRGELDGALMSDIALGAIDGGVRVLDLPLVFDSVDELVEARRTVGAELERGLAEQGFVRIAWVYVGPLQLYSTRAITTVEDLHRAKVWLWEGDPVMRAFLTRLGATVVALEVWEVSAALEDGTIDTVYGSPLVVAALAWNTKVKYLTDLALAQRGGAIVVTGRAWASLSVADQAVLADETRAHADARDAKILDDHAWAVTEMTKDGLQVVAPSAALVAELRRQAAAARAALDGEFYPRELRLAVERAAGL